MKKRLFRFAAPVALAGALVGGSVAVASPAQASASDCREYLAKKGYSVGPIVKGNCAIASIGTPDAENTCYVNLVKAGVEKAHARHACVIAAD